MRRTNALVVLVLTALLAMPVIPAAAQDEEPAAAPRSEYRQAGTAEIELKANGSKYESTAFRIPVPADASVTSASCDITGRYVKGSLAYAATDYNDDTAGHKAYKASTNTFTRNTRVWSLAQSQISGSDLSSLTAADGDTLDQMGDWTDQDGYELFNLKVPVDESRTIVVNWRGYASVDTQHAYIVYVWNNFSSIWELLDTAAPTQPVDVRVQLDTDYYIDNRSVWVLAINDNGGYIHTDYVNITVSGYPYIWPKNPQMDIGADGKAEWSLAADRFDYTVTAAESAMLTALDTFSRAGRDQFVNVTVRFVSDTPCKIKISQFAFNYSAPPWCKPIPNLFIDEDSLLSSVLDLNAYFTDDLDRKFSYQVTYQQDPKKVQALINADNHTLDMKTVTRNWWGTLNFRVAATDSEGLAGESDNFTLTVRPVNDPPVIPQITDQTTSQGMPYSYKISARDVDVDLDPSEYVTYNDSVSFFQIDPRTGWINFTPNQSDVGTWYICVTAVDTQGAEGSQLMTMIIQDVQDPPVMKAIPDRTAEEGVQFTLAVNVTDPDLPYGDSLTFSDDCPLFNISQAGVISFFPTIDVVGFYRCNITVKDSRGGKATSMFNLSVFNSIGTFDHPPSVEPIPNFTLVVGTPFTWQVNASDPDEDDTLDFKDNSPVFNIGPANGTISFTPRASDEGTYTVKITVSDWEGLEAVTTFRLVILKFNSPPNITSVKPRSGLKVLYDKEVVFSADATDPEGDRVTYTWTEGNRTLGRGSSIVAIFSLPGTYTVTLSVSDGRDEALYNITIRVVQKLDEPRKSPGFETVLAVAAAALAAVAIGLGRKRR